MSYQHELLKALPLEEDNKELTEAKRLLFQIKEALEDKAYCKSLGVWDECTLRAIKGYDKIYGL